MLRQLWEYSGGDIEKFDYSPYSRDLARAFSPDGKRFAVSINSTLKIYDAESLQLLAQEVEYGPGQPYTARTSQIIWSPDGSRILADDNSGGVYLYDSSTCEFLKIWYANWEFNELTENISAIVVTPDWRLFAKNDNEGYGQGVLIAGETGRIGGVYDLSTLEKLYNIPDFAMTVSRDWRWYTYTFSYDGSKLYIFSLDELMVLDAQTGAPIDSMPYTGLGGMALSPDGARLAFYAKTDKTVPSLFVINPDTATELWHADAPIERGTNTRILWSPDGTLIAVHNEDMEKTVVYDADSGEVVLEADGDSPSFSPDSAYLLLRRAVISRATSINTGTDITYEGVMIDIGSGFIMARLPAPGIFSPDGQTVLMQDAVWPVKTLAQLIDDARRVLGGRQLTREERRQYYLD